MRQFPIINALTFAILLIMFLSFSLFAQKTSFKKPQIAVLNFKGRGITKMKFFPFLIDFAESLLKPVFLPFWNAKEWK